MAIFKTSALEENTSSFLDVLGSTDEIEGNVFKLTEEQKQFLLSQNEVPIEDCQAVIPLFEELKSKYNL